MVPNSKIRRGRRSRRPAGNEAVVEGGRGPGGLGETLAMPTYEWVDLRDLGEAQRPTRGMPSAGGERQAGGGEAARRGRRRREEPGHEPEARRGRRRPEGDHQAGAIRRPAAQPHLLETLPPSDQDKPNLLSRLFGWMRKD